MGVVSLLSKVIHTEVVRKIINGTVVKVARTVVGKIKIKKKNRVNPVNGEVEMAENGSGQFGPKDKKQTITVLGVTVGVLPIYNFLFVKLLGLSGSTAAVSFFADSEVQYVALPLLGGALGFITSRLQDND